MVPAGSMVKHSTWFVVSGTCLPYWLMKNLFSIALGPNILTNLLLISNLTWVIYQKQTISHMPSLSWEVGQSIHGVSGIIIEVSPLSGHIVVKLKRVTVKVSQCSISCLFKFLSGTNTYYQLHTICLVVTSGEHAVVDQLLFRNHGWTDLQLNRWIGRIVMDFIVKLQNVWLK